MSQNLEHGTPLRPWEYNPVPLASDHYPPDAPNDPQAQLEVIDGSEAIFAMYMEMSLREDKEMVEGWNQDAQSILLFSGLFSATVAATLGPSVPNPNVDPQFATVYLLENIYDLVLKIRHQMVLPNKLGVISGAEIVKEKNLFNYIHFQSTPFNQGAYFALVNSLWFLSLVISLTCAMLAILLQQWTRRYLRDARQQRGALYNQARVRQFLAEGIRGSGVAVLVDVMRACHQLSFALFTLGLLLYFWDSHSAAFVIVAAWSVLSVCLYLGMTIAGILRHNSPYHTPLSSLLHRISQLIVLVAFIFMYPLTGTRFTWAAFSNRVEEISRKLIPKGMRKATEESAQKLSQGLDNRTLDWTFNSLSQDHEFERFFAGIPDFCNSRAVKDPVDHVLKLNDKEKLSRTLIGLLHQTVTSRHISEPARQQRIKICVRVIDAVPTLASGSTLRRVFGEWEGLLGSVDFGSAISPIAGDRNSGPRTVFCARCIVAIIIARAQAYDDPWFKLTAQFLTSDMEVWAGISQPTLRGYLQHDHSALLANLIFIARVIFRFHSEHSRNTLFDVSSRTLSELLSNIDVRLASPDMQHEYCDLWNELVHQAQDGTGPYIPPIAKDILRHLRKGYTALHESTDASPSSYPLCNIQSHRRTSLQTTANLPIPHSSRPPLPASISPNVGVPATADADDPYNVSSLMAEWPESAPDLALAPMPPRPTLAAHRHPSVEITPTEQESHDAPVAQSDRISSNLEPPLTPDAGPTSAVPDASATVTSP